ncbi:ROK family protein [Pararhodonellum marinum]|uniref:ROK family protein n=1 Tax=Pararhodonellum marinum TaxID=2755358 RepID=UPI00189071BC|nr:ROK family protein [Pararhodonellum marinum]
MDNQKEHFLGVDVGGTHLKIGLVSREGEIIDFFKEDTQPLSKSPTGFNVGFVEVVGKYLSKFKQVQKVGIGLPGLISKDRTTTLEIPAIRSLDGFHLKGALLERYPGKSFFLENDASAAALGEFRFGKSKASPNFLFITMGTGIGSACVIDGEIFKGSRGNAMEMGHMLSRGNVTLEKLIGRDGILHILDQMVNAYPEKAEELLNQELGTHLMVDSAKSGNQVALLAFQEVGDILGEAIVSTMRILDVNEVYFGGGISAGLEFMMPSIDKTIRQYITPYYHKDLKLKKATLGNNAGTLGAAALCFMGSGL